MASYMSGRSKRKDLDDVYDDFSDFSFAAPPTKIRRMDAEMLPIADKLEPFAASAHRQQLPEEEMSSVILNERSELTESYLPSTLNEERALVMYKPRDAHFVPSLKINPELITSLKNYTFWPRNPNMIVNKECEENMRSPSNKCLAVVPWVSPPFPGTLQAMEEALVSVNEPIEEEPIDALMDIEEDSRESGDSGVGAQGHQQWLQHCLTPQLLQGNSTIMWS